MLFYICKYIRIKKFSQIEHFEAVFVSKTFEVKEFGTSDKVLIFEKNTRLVEHEISFLQNNASWANLIYILPVAYKEKYDNYRNIYTYKNEKEIFENFLSLKLISSIVYKCSSSSR